jgi:hypothetical protein
MRSLVPLLICGLSMTATQALAQVQAPVAPAAATRPQPGTTSNLTIDAGSGQVIQTGRAIANLFAADPNPHFSHAI